ncbi:16845_t:CDS:1, partial [Acaulospora colombiana]
QVSPEFTDRLAELLKVLDTRCDLLDDFNIIIFEQTPGILELNPPSFSHTLRRRFPRPLKLTCSAPLITFLKPICFPTQVDLAEDSTSTANNAVSSLCVHAVIQSVWSLNHYLELYGSQITRAHLSFEGLSDIWILRLIGTCFLLQELVLERTYVDDDIEITDATLNELCMLSELNSLAFVSKCGVPLTYRFSLASWRTMLNGTPKLEKIDLSGLDPFFISRALPSIAENYKFRPLW